MPEEESLELITFKHLLSGDLESFEASLKLMEDSRLTSYKDTILQLLDSLNRIKFQCRWEKGVAYVKGNGNNGNGAKP